MSAAADAADRLHPVAAMSKSNYARGLHAAAALSVAAGRLHPCAWLPDPHRTAGLSASDLGAAMPQRRDSLHRRELPDAAECLPTHGADRLPAYAAEHLHHRGEPELSGAGAGHAGASWAAAAVRGSSRATDAERRASVRRQHRAAGVPSERERDLPDAKRGASVRRQHARAPAMPSERECDLPDAERGASVRRQHRGAGVPSERERDLPDAERGASVRRQHRGAGVPSERERDLPDAERGASVRHASQCASVGHDASMLRSPGGRWLPDPTSMSPADRELHDDTGPVRRVYAVLSAVTRNEGGAARAAWPCKDLGHERQRAPRQPRRPISLSGRVAQALRAGGWNRNSTPSRSGSRRPGSSCR